jgi:hypothetical protein
MNTLLEQYMNVISSNVHHTTYKKRWQFYLESYMGGEEYRSGGHLTRYVNETAAEYNGRLMTTPLDNHCRSVISVYTSFLFRRPPQRELGPLQFDSTVEAFLEDADMEGRDLDSFMKEVSVWSNVFGHCWVIMCKPDVGAETMADEITAGVRPYVNMITPLSMIDWRWSRTPRGSYELEYVKYVEDVNDTISTIKVWTREEITTYVVNSLKKEVVSEQRVVNGLGRVPAVICYGTRSPVRGIGVSDISDIADHQKKIYNELSEVEQSIRLNGHPTVVKTPDVEMSAGAGSIALMPDNMDPGLKPYMLNVSTDISAIYNSIQNSVSAIDKMANTGAVRATESKVLSGVAMQTEFELLNAKLSEKADNLELAEEQIWQYYALYQNTEWQGLITYPSSFNIQDTDSDISRLKTARDTATDPRLFAYIDRELVTALGGDVDEVFGGEVEQHATTTPENRTAHIQQMIMEGYTDQQILDIHPEITQSDITAAKTQLLELGDNYESV